jgi:hypothetical protein
MESMCRQRASFYPGEAWKYLAEAEMWHHKGMDLVVSELPDSRQIGHVIGAGFVAGAGAVAVAATT